MRKDIKFSIITVTYNAVSTLEETILSVINQRNVNFEYIIIDGGSSDGTIELIKKYSEYIIWTSESDKGIYDAMNKGLKQATGDFVIFLGADDHFISFNVLSEVESHIQSIDNVYYGDVYRNRRNDLYKGKFNKYKLSLANICHQSIFYPKSVYKKYIYDLKYKVYADYYYNLTIFPKYKFIYIPTLISYYNYEGFSSRIKDDAFNKNVNKYIYVQNGILAWILRCLYLLYKKII